MSDADKFRANARFCIDMAEKVNRPADKIAWLQTAQTWLGMIPELQRTALDGFDAVIRQRATGQTPPPSEH